ncbi:MarR family transcriptional regulator [archaeon]|nr:MarR family transcriptional regulator [archaeon]MBT4352579.1 MarR family transcriptional regulator [archaeon]MBT4647796.1 MarR family transcriptional regulator [archaeon]MBT6821657.1 MarR family transcriptional regulator [archaeon]MBT7391815.1 MarR family transcriptional regulator [archaeon]
MTLNKMQLTIIEQIIDSNAGLSSFELFSKLKRSQSQISYTLTSLVKEGLIEKKKTFYFISKYVHAQYLKDLYLSTRINLGRILSNNRIKFLTAILEPKSIQEIMTQSELKKSVVYKYIKEFQEFGIIKKLNSKFIINEQKWLLIKEFILEYTKFKQRIDYRIPSNAQILFKNDKKVIFRYDFEFDAQKTAFSKFSKNGIKIYPVGTIYRFPKKKLSIKKVYIDALDISKDYRDYMFDILFYLKHKKKLSNVKHKLNKEIKEHLINNNIKHLPSHKEIKEKANDYDLKWQ